VKILICGLPGSGKTTLAKCLYEMLWDNDQVADWFNADEIRAQYNDWDFSAEGRLRQATRMRLLCNESDYQYTISDFVAPTEETRTAFNADFIVWVDTIQSGRFEDTNNVFEAPTQYNVRVTTKDAAKWAKDIYERLSN